MADSLDLIIIGGGAAGLTAADALSDAGKSVLLLEARPRLGGRIETMHDPAWPIPIERGAEFVHGKPPETWQIIREGLCAYDVADDFSVFANGRLQKSDFFEQVEKVLAIVHRARKTDLTFDDCIAEFGGRYSPAARRAARAFVQGFDAADPAIVSAQWLAAAQKASDEIDGDRAFRLLGGYDRLIQFLQTGLKETSTRIELASIVRRIQWSDAGATVEAETLGAQTRSWSARRILITVPVGVLQLAPGEEGHIAFDPPLPAEKRAAIAGLRMGPVVKIILRFREPFWEKRYPDLAFFTAPGMPIPTWWTSLPLRTTMLTGWAGGPVAQKLAGRDTAAVLDQATATLAKLLSTPRRRVADLLAGAHVCDWQMEPFSRGAYSYAAVGGARTARTLAQPLANTLYFAGEAVHSGMTGTVAAAIASGRHAARQILSN